MGCPAQWPRAGTGCSTNRLLSFAGSIPEICAVCVGAAAGCSRGRARGRVCGQGARRRRLSIASNVEGVNLGELALDELWDAAVKLDAPIFIHPVQAMPTPRTAKFALAQIAQYTFDTTLCVGSLIFSGVLDRFPDLRIILAHGGGTFPYLIGRFDCMHARMDRAAQGDVAISSPSAYVRRFHYDTILHSAMHLRWLAEAVGVERMLLGSDYSFPSGRPRPRRHGAQGRASPMWRPQRSWTTMRAS